MQFKLAIHSFQLDTDFLLDYVNKKPKFGPLGEITYLRTYSRIKPDGSGKEHFWETLKRVTEGTFSIQKNHCEQYNLPWDDEKAQRTAQRMFKAMWEFKFLPPGRGLWTMGTDVVSEKGGAALNNCAFISTENIDADPAAPFGFLMDMSMLGVGVGFDTKGAEKIQIKNPEESEDKRHYVIPDTREGWVESTNRLITSYLSDLEPRWSFDYSEIRPYGSPIAGFGGQASGPKPLVKLHNQIFNLLTGRSGDVLMSSDIVDLMNMIGCCVVAGNVRRSAEIALGSPSDEAFAKLKLDREKLASHRWASNNSVVVDNGDDYRSLARSTATNGEPGYFWLDTARKYGRLKDPPTYKDQLVAGTNPCSEQSLESYELCCLVETFPANHDSLSEFFETLKLAYMYAKTVTLVPTHCSATNAVLLRNRRIGCSQSGIVQAFQKHGRRETFIWCDKGYSFIRGLDKQYSAWLCVPESIKTTSVKPSGTVSLLAGATPGIHFPHSEYYIRRIRFARGSDLVDKLENSGYSVEPDQSQPDDTVVISFPVREKWFDRSKTDVSIWEQMENVAQYQAYWADNQVSATVTFTKDEAQDIPRVLELYESRLKSISFLPLNDHGYAQAPYEEITREHYEEMVKRLSSQNVINTTEDAIGSRYCDSETCTI